ncbi:MAG TPA: hypothetical protein VJP80_06335 [Candidatus Saccharimonadales bacterium]|nr:hypothetical protein [Candidatus Saccharimonadales bacterium]
MQEFAPLPPPAIAEGLVLPTHDEQIVTPDQQRVPLWAQASVIADLPGVDLIGRGMGLAAGACVGHNVISATVGATVAVAATEFAAATGVSRVLASERSGRITRHLHRILGKVGIGEQGLDTSVTSDLELAFFGGTSVMSANKQIFNPDRTYQENVKYNRKIAACVTAASVPFSYLAAEGLSDLATVERAGALAIGVGGLAALGRKARRQIQRRAQRQSTTKQAGAYEPAEARFDLSEIELSKLESSMLDRVRQTHGNKLCAVWIKSDMPEANLLRAREAQALPDVNVENLFSPHESNSYFLAMVDARRRVNRVIRGTRITGRQFNPDRRNGDGHDGNGLDMAMLSDMVVDGEISAEELRHYYNQSGGIDLNKSFAVETNFRIGERAPRRFGVMSMAALSYLCMYRRVVNNDFQASDVAIFAHANRATLESLDHAGVDTELVAGRRLHTPAGTSEADRYDDKFTPIAMLNTNHTARSMSKLRIFAPRELIL